MASKFIFEIFAANSHGNFSREIPTANSQIIYKMVWNNSSVKENFMCEDKKSKQQRKSLLKLINLLLQS